MLKSSSSLIGWATIVLFEQRTRNAKRKTRNYNEFQVILVRRCKYMELIAQFGLFSGILALLLILGYAFRRNTNKVFLGLSLLFVWYTLLILYLNDTGLILQFAHLQRTGLITAYLAFPFLFIYSRNTFYPGKLWRGTDWILLIPALIYIIDFIPFFALSADNKNLIWKQNLANNQKMFLANEGLLGLPGFHFTFFYIWTIIIMYLQVRLIARNWHLKNGFKSAHNRRLLYFIVTITTLYIPMFFPGIFGVLLKSSWFNPRFISVTFGVSLSTVSIYLLVFPSILYGFLPERKFSFSGFAESNGQPVAKEVTLPEREQLTEFDVVKKSDVELSEEPIGNHKEQIPPELSIVIQHMSTEKPFRKQGFTIQDLSNQTGIPVYQLSPLINGYFKMNFANWVNRNRVEYFLELATDNAHLTLEALSREAGFISRSTFINAFKKEKGVTPSEYLKDLKRTVS